MPQWLFLLHPPRPTFADDMTPGEQVAMGAHFDRLERATRDGMVVIAGPVTDCSAPGIVVFEAATEAEARAFVDEDPAVVAGVVRATLHPFRISLLRAG